MQSALPAPTAQGNFAKTPLPHLVVYALERRLSGSFELSLGVQSSATLLVLQGFPAKLRTSDQVHPLGEVMASLGLITPEQLQASLLRLQESPRLQGQILCEMGAADEARVEMGLRAQIERKLEYLFAMPADTTFAYYDGVDLLQRYGAKATPTDPLPALWRGVRVAPAWEHVDATIRRIGSLGVRLTANAQLQRLGLDEPELQTAMLLRTRALRVIDLTNANLVPPQIAQLLLYFLVITKQVDLVDSAPLDVSAAAPSPPAPGSSSQSLDIPSPTSSNPLVAPVSSSPMSAPMSGSPQSGAQAFARVQLQARSVQRAPLVVEEAVTVTRGDDRISSLSSPAGATPVANAPIVVPAMAPVPAIATPADIASLITHTIQSSLPPAAASMPAQPMSAAPPAAPAITVAPPVPSPVASVPAPAPSAAPAATPSAAPATFGGGESGAGSLAPGASPNLTAEQNVLKTKILERAEQITSQNYYEMLGIPEDAPTTEIQKAFIGLAKVWHPDRLPPALIDVKDHCGKVFTHLTEAHAVLSDAKKRAEYTTLLREGGATPDDQAKIQVILEAATEFQKAEILLKRNPNDPEAVNLVRRAVSLDPEQPDYMALMTWIDAQSPQWLSREKTLEKIAVLDKCIKKSEHCERAYFYRGMLYKRIEEGAKATRDFKKAAELNPRNLDAAREVRLYNMRGGAKGANSTAPGNRNSKQPPPEKGGLLGKLFKK